MAPFITEDTSDEDSIATDTTVEEEPENGVYTIEKILGERYDQATDQTLYLIKWQGYPLGEASEEPTSNFVEGTDLALDEWHELKSRAADGLEELLDYQLWYDAVEQHWEQLRGKKRRREAKKRKRAQAISSSKPSKRFRRPARVIVDDEDDDDDDDASGEAPPPAQSKGVPKTPSPVSSPKRSQGSTEKVTRSVNLLKAAIQNTPHKARDVSRSRNVSKGIQKKRREKIPTPMETTELAEQENTPVQNIDAATETALESADLAVPRLPTPETVLPSVIQTPDHVSPQASAPGAEPGQALEDEVSPPVQQPVAPPSAHMMLPSRQRSQQNPASPKPTIPTQDITPPETVSTIPIGSAERPHRVLQQAMVPPTASMLPSTSEQPSQYTTLSHDTTPSTGEQLPHRTTISDHVIPSDREPTQDTPWRSSEGSGSVQNATVSPTMPPVRQPSMPDSQLHNKAKPRNLPNDAQFRNLAEQNRVHKHGNREAAPSMEALTFLDPKTGKSTAVSQQSTQSAQDHRAVYRNGRSPPRERRPPTPSPPRGDRVSLSRTTSYDTQPQTESQVTNRRFPGTTCFHWKNSKCRYPDSMCEYAHHDTGNIGPRTVSTFSKRQTTCFYWARGGCTKPDHECDFAHCDTGIIATQPGRFISGPLQSEPEFIEKTLPSDNEYGSKPRLSLTKEKKMKTCFFWHRGHCTKSESACSFAHEDTGILADPPRGLSISEAYGSFYETNGSDTGAPRADFRGEEIVSKPAETVVSVEITDASGVRCSFPAKMTAQNRTDLVEFTQILGPTKKLVMTQIVTAADFHRYMWTKQPSGSHLLTCDVNNKPELDSVATKITKLCRIHASGMVANCDSHCAVLFPANAEEWNFAMEDRVENFHKSSQMRLVLLPFSGGRMIEDQVSYQPQPANADSIFLSLGLSSERITLISEVPLKHAHRKVFLFYESDHLTERSIVVRFFKSIGYETQVGDSDSDIAVSKRDQGCLVVMHPLFPFHAIHRLQTFLKLGMRFWQIGHDKREEHDSQPNSVWKGFVARRLFPANEYTLITDDVVLNDPTKAAQVIDLWVQYARGKEQKDGIEEGRIAMRPDALDWVRDLALSRTERTETSGDPSATAYMNVYRAISRLCPEEDLDVFYLPDRRVPAEHSWLVTLDLDLQVYEKASSQDRMAATSMLIENFAHDAILKAGDFRRFKVIHEGNLQQEENNLARKYAHLSIVGPDEWIAAKENPSC